MNKKILEFEIWGKMRVRERERARLLGMKRVRWGK